MDFNHEGNSGIDHLDSGGADFSSHDFKGESKSPNSKGSSIQEDQITQALDEKFDSGKDENRGHKHKGSVIDPESDGLEQLPGKSGDEPAKSPGDIPDASSNQFDVDPDSLTNVQSLDPTQVKSEDNLEGRLGARGDFLDGGGGNNVVIGAGDNDVIFSNTPDAFNTITSGTGKDLIVLGPDSSSRIFDFDPASDQFGLDGLNPDEVQFGQGSNLEKGGIDQPLDSISNTIVFDRTTDNILASLTFVNATDLSSNNFVTIDSKDSATNTDTDKTT